MRNIKRDIQKDLTRNGWRLIDQVGTTAVYAKFITVEVGRQPTIAKTRAPIRRPVEDDLVVVQKADPSSAGELIPPPPPGFNFDR